MNLKGIIKFLLLYGLCTLVLGNLHSQTTNPFDIIITNSDAAKTSSTSQLDSTIINQQTKNDSAQQILIDDYDRIDSVTTNLDKISLDQSSDSLSRSGLITSREDNPFNIQSGSKPAPIIIKEELSSSRAKPKLPVTSKPSISLKSSKWLPTLKPRVDGNIKQDYSLNFIFWILITSLLIVAVVINLKRKSFLNLYRAITNDNYLKLLQREENNGASSFFLLLYFLFFLNAALYLYQLVTIKFQDQGYRIFLTFIGFLVLIYFIRFISTFLMQFIFPLEKELKQFNFTIMMFNIIVGLLLIPVNILIAYAPFGPTIIYSGLVILALFYLLRQLRGLFIAARVKGLSYFHFFIYLCNFEVAPIIWLLSIIKN